MFFSGIEPAPADPILGLTEAFRKDPRPFKVNLGVGVFMDEKGTTPVLECVKRAERLLWETEKTKGYTPISGPTEFGDAVAKLVFGADFHGLALNVNMDMTPFLRINPCGYAGMAMTQTSALGGPQSVAEAQSILVAELANLIGYQTIINTEEAA